MQLTLEELKEFNAGAVAKYEDAISKAHDKGNITSSGRDILDYWNARMFSIIATKNILFNSKIQTMKIKRYKVFFDAKDSSGFLIQNDSIVIDKKKDAEKEARLIVDYYNSTLNPTEHPREFIKVNSVEEVDETIEEDDDFDGDEFDDEDLEDWDGLEEDDFDDDF